MTAATFMRAYRRSTVPNPCNDRERVWGCAAIALEPRDDDVVQLNMVRALLKQQGWGTRALQWLCQLADRHGCTLVGRIVPTGKLPRLNKCQLKRWYTQHGFTVYPDWWMERRPDAKP